MESPKENSETSTSAHLADTFLYIPDPLSINTFENGLTDLGTTL